MKILAGDLEPTAGEVIKSSKDLRVSFLRQEFVDELVMERSLKEELISAFTEEVALLHDLQACEVGSGHEHCILNTDFGVNTYKTSNSFQNEGV